MTFLEDFLVVLWLTALKEPDYLKHKTFFFFQLSFPSVVQFLTSHVSIRLVGFQSEYRAFFQSMIVALFSKHQSCNNFFN